MENEITAGSIEAPLEKNGKPRLDHIDVAKGIAILLVIMGHTFNVWKIRVNWIFTFHMPLFFILSGYFFKSGRKINYFKMLKTFIFPYLGLNILRIALQYVSNPAQLDVKKQLLGTLYGNAYVGWKNICLIDGVPVIGMTWFLLALFWCRIIYNELNKLAEKYGFSMFWATAILAFASMELNTKICPPFSLLPGITAMFFYHIGRVIRERKIFDLKLKDIPFILIILSLVIWECCCLYGHLRLNENRILLMMDIIVAVIGTFYVVKISMGAIKIPLLGAFFKWCGKYSMVIYGLHSLDGIIMYEVCKFIPAFNKIDSWGEYWIYLAVRIGVILAIAFVYVSLKNLILYLNDERKEKKLKSNTSEG